MNLLDLTLPTPAENLACDEALLDFFEQHGGEGLLRFWVPENYFVVVGYGNHVETEANVAACAAAGIPILRRCSGGGTVLQGPGCLNYSLVLQTEAGGPLASISAANRFIMERNRAALANEIRRQQPSAGIEVRGHTDLALSLPPAAPLKFSGNAQRRKKNYLLFHGTLLLAFDLPRIEQFLRMPSLEPDYRLGRTHRDFLTNLNLPADIVKRALREAWQAEDSPEAIPHDDIALLARDRYVTDAWNLKF